MYFISHFSITSLGSKDFQSGIKSLPRFLMKDKKFNPKQIHKLTDPRRLEFQPPELLWKTLNVKSPKVLVDIGAGTGFFAMPFCDRSDGIVYACDSSEVMIDWMQENLPSKYRDKIIPYKTEENNTGLDPGIGDAVYMINLHHELEDPTKMLLECFRIIKPGGKIMIVDWKYKEMEMGPPLSLRIPAEKIKEQLGLAGFNKVETHEILDFHCCVTGSKP